VLSDQSVEFFNNIFHDFYVLFERAMDVL